MTLSRFWFMVSKPIEFRMDWETSLERFPINPLIPRFGRSSECEQPEFYIQLFVHFGVRLEHRRKELECMGPLSGVRSSGY